MFDITFRNAKIYDGTGAPPYTGDVAIRGERIAEISQDSVLPAKKVIDASGLVLAPGFIDIHSHSDLTLLLDPRARSSVRQGVTLEVIGNCGHGCAPIHSAHVARIAMYGPQQPDSFFTWSTMEGYLDRLEAERPAVNVVALVPYGQLRLQHVGLEQRPAAPHELEQMKTMLHRSLDEGAFGFSTGLEYVQERSSSIEEVVDLCRIVSQHGGIYATHTRDRDQRALEAIDEAIQVAQTTNVQLQISHITPRTGPDDTERALYLVDAARKRGLDVGFDMHTRSFGFTHLKNVLPLWVLDGSIDDIRARLNDASVIEKIHAHRNLITGVGDWEKVVLVDSVALSELNGQSFKEIAGILGMAPLAAAIHILKMEGPGIHRPMVRLKTYSEALLESTYRHPECMIGSDATALAPDGALKDEKFYGSYTWASWFLRHMVKNVRHMKLEEAIYRLTGLPAKTLKLGNRGLIKRGYFADIAVLDWEDYGERGTVEEPSKLAEGVRYLMVNGDLSIDDGQETGIRSGSVLRSL